MKRRLSRSKRNVARRTRLPSWCRFGWRKLPQCWRRWWRCQTSLTPEEINELAEVLSTKLWNRPQVIALDRVTTPVLSMLRKATA